MSPTPPFDAPHGCATAGSGTAYAWADAVRQVERLHVPRREYGRGDEPFEILLDLLDVPSRDLYRRAADMGVTAVMCAPC